MSEMTEGEALAQLGMDQAVQAASVKFVKMARWWIKNWSVARRTFTADDLLLALESVNVHTPEHRALGGIIRTAHRDGLITPTGRYVPSSRPVSHARPCREWIGTGFGKDRADV